MTQILHFCLLFLRVSGFRARASGAHNPGESEAPVKQDVFVRVFINKPDASAATSIDDPHYAGSFAFFCCEEDAMKGHEAMTPTPESKPSPGRPPVSATPAAATPASRMPKLRYLVDVTPTIRRLSQGGSLASDLDLTLVTVPIVPQRRVETRSLTLGRLELAVAQF